MAESHSVREDGTNEEGPAAERPAPTVADIEEVSDYLDVDMVNLYEEDFHTIGQIRKLSNTAMDKLTFTIFAMNIITTGFCVGYVPQHYYIFYSVKAIILITYRWYIYKRTKNHYFMLDFCYFTNMLVLLYLWVPYFSAIRGALFPIVYSFSMGPLMAAIVLWRNSLVPHSTDKMTSLFIHTSPSLALWGIRWYSTEEQGFPLCANSDRPGPSGCGHVDIWQTVIWPLALYLVWQLMYAVVVFLWRKKQIEERQYQTSYVYLVEKTKTGILFNLFSLLGPKYRKLLYMVWQMIYTVISMLLVYPSYHSLAFNMIVVNIMLAVASYNGASFYIDVFSQRYHPDSVMKQKENGAVIKEKVA